MHAIGQVSYAPSHLNRDKHSQNVPGPSHTGREQICMCDLFHWSVPGNSAIGAVR